MSAVSSRTLDSITASTGEPTQRSSIRSPPARSYSQAGNTSGERCRVYGRIEELEEFEGLYREKIAALETSGGDTRAL
jgi:hypothetical protein